MTVMGSLVAMCSQENPPTFQYRVMDFPDFSLMLTLCFENNDPFLTLNMTSSH